uniref:D-sedoheptulose 7-phosphate isomerase n=1 Tax=Candidatus Kentrum sp. FM TaxID=2126340 RepID=A0A450SD10_9GAMM|nr:MAG: D-sedoheptulose 7-phosphate isomerase [Candidatus Kentron sp. FM]VFJ50363.1 MAG: D-sedoheptulose 7-phosphate isomerase [Candidatus Kentron sp. FM]VFK08600.1 MAG: D-sedoheptulose 7-phosphate isomerase [Candidatus Kentron sp. FM]
MKSVQKNKKMTDSSTKEHEEDLRSSSCSFVSFVDRNLFLRGFVDLMENHINNYRHKLSNALGLSAMEEVPVLGAALLGAWKAGHHIYLCGNGGSAGNALHLANDFIYGAGVRNGAGLRVEALSANPAVITCLANDVDYERIYAEQIRVKGRPGDVLIALSGSGNSPNIVRAIESGNALDMTTFAILGFTGGRCKEIARHSIHFPVDDMQIAEDLQLIVGHICMQWLREQEVHGGKCEAC